MVHSKSLNLMVVGTVPSAPRSMPLRKSSKGLGEWVFPGGTIPRVGIAKRGTSTPSGSSGHQVGHPHLRSAPAAGPRPDANQVPPGPGPAPLALPQIPDSPGPLF